MAVFTEVEEFGAEYAYILDNDGDFSGFSFEEGQVECDSLNSTLTSISSELELDLVLDLAFASAIDQGFLIDNVNNNLVTRIGLTHFLQEDQFVFEDGSDASFFFDLNLSPPWKEDPFELSNFTGEIEVSAIFSINKNRISPEFGFDANLFFLDRKEVTYGIICKRNLIEDEPNDEDDSDNEEDENNGDEVDNDDEIDNDNDEGEVDEANNDVEEKIMSYIFLGGIGSCAFLLVATFIYLRKAYSELKNIKILQLQNIQLNF